MLTWHPRQPATRRQSRNSTRVCSAVAGASAAPADLPLPAPAEPLRSKHGVVVVGGGPSGVAAALALVQVRGWTGVTIVERSHDLSWADPDRSYVYGIDGRGMELARILGIAGELKLAGVDVTQAEIAKVNADGRVDTIPFMIKDQTRTTYWMPRAAMMKILARQVERHNAAAFSEDHKIQVLTSTRVQDLQLVPDLDGRGQRIAVRVLSADGRLGVLHPSMVLGCDGVNSTVRTTLQDWAHKDAAAGAPTFELRRYPSPSSGLRFKVLWLPPNPVTKAGQAIPNPAFGVLVGKYRGRTLRLGLLPVKDVTAPRTANIITKPDHPFWEIPLGDVVGYRQALREAFPQIDLDALVPEDVMKAFSDSKGGVFPAPQASDGMAYVVKDSSSNSSQGSSTELPSALLLIGDSAHAFPPDLGQGVNAALQDVNKLLQYLENHSDSLAPAAEAYNQELSPEADALAKIVQIGAPYQYQQDFWGAKLFVVGFAVRSLLNKVFGSNLISPATFFMIQDVDLTYVEILKRTVETQRRILYGLGLLGATAVLLFFGA